MKYITAITEKRITKAACKDNFGFWAYDEAGTLAAILDDIKNRYGWYGASVAEAKKNGQQFSSASQLTGFAHRTNVLFDWTIRFPELVNYSNTLGLDVLTIFDFNGLVKAVLDD